MAIRAPWPLVLLLITTFTSASALNKGRPRFGVLREDNREKSLFGVSLATSSEYKAFYYDQTLDHFNYQPESYTTFKQRYFLRVKNWGGARAAAPIFAYLGMESALDGDNIGSIGFLIDNSLRFGALELYIEHRFYGQSIPFGGTQQEALKNATTRGYFSSAQAIADYAEIIQHVKKKFSAENSPVIVYGGSYGGMLASWFRLKYPHVAIGALASSAPILYFDDLTPEDGYYSVVTKDFKEASESCYSTIKSSWSEIDRVAATPNGLDTLSKKFKTCKPVGNASRLKEYLDALLCIAAQSDRPSRNPVNVFCKGIDGGSEGTDILGRIFSGIVAYTGNSSCYDFDDYLSSDETTSGWDWQTCTEFVMPISYGNDTMFPVSHFDYNEFSKKCKDKFGVSPRPHWITSYYGVKVWLLLLASWFRLKYPHVAIGALASSAPILYFDDITPEDGYYSVVTKDFKEASESCYSTIKSSWSEIDRVAATPNGLDTLSKKFKTCKPVGNAFDLKDYLDSLFSVAAQYDLPPRYPVNVFCKGIDGGFEGTDILGRIFSGIVAYRGNKTCYDFEEFFSSETLNGWDWQTCSEFVMPISYGNDTMFPADHFDYNEFSKKCKDKYGVSPRPHWITSYYGGKNIKLVLQKFGSNIIFTNGLRDPYSSAGVLENLSDSIVALTTPQGSHCLDILPKREDDPKWLIRQRNKAVKIIKGWIRDYYQDLHQISAQVG